MQYVTELLHSGWMGDVTTLGQIQLLSQLNDEQAAALCFVSPHTYRRWRSDRQPNPMAVRLLSVLAGYVPWPGWSHWEMHDGLLYPPGYTRHGIRPGDVLAVPFRLQLLGAYEQKINQLEWELAQHGERSPEDVDTETKGPDQWRSL